MQNNIWDGKPRRKNDIYLEAIVNKVDQQFSFLKGEFGDEDLSGNKIEGRTSKSIRQLTEQVEKQNGRVKKLEEDSKTFKIRIKTGAVIFGTLFTIIDSFIMWIKK